MTLYLDASVLVPLFIEEECTQVAEAAIEKQVLVVSDFAAAEFSSAIGRRVRMGDIPLAEAAPVFDTFDAWCARSA